MENRILVCITPQSNSRRLIDKGCEFLSENAQLHILHVEKGNRVFSNPQSVELLQELFDYGSSFGGVVHGICSKGDIASVIQKFALKEKISTIILGAADKNYESNPEDVINKIKAALPHLAVIVLSREEQI